MPPRVPVDIPVQQLRIFIVLGEELHFGRTAERLLMTQPHVSRSLTALERKVGGRLLDRTSRRVQLTTLGEHLHAEVTVAYDHVAQALERAQRAAAGVRDTLVVGCTATTAGPAMTALVEEFERTHPAYRVRMRELPLNHPYDALRKGAVDVMVFWLADDAPEFTNGPVIEEQPMVLAMRRGHPLSGQREVSLEALGDYGVPAMADVDGPKTLEHTLYPSVTPTGRPVPRIGPPCRTMSEAIDTLARTDAAKPTGQSVAISNAHRADLVFRPIIDTAPLRLGPLWLRARRSEAVAAFAATAHGQSGANRA